ncbi:cupin domain-containing protein [Cesiribacter andamanensis]|uniref:Cupin domain protein n=1 Tax=Cesiribacter andamanensis AMV16 TaxID=1279009 RepID=M7N409_9BACT|nr:cupin domain-containing protein [Cesiribacter andamanensis]EMR01951.1 Cupin domain protein [Cesiribacter andamanensis AMV16]
MITYIPAPHRPEPGQERTPEGLPRTIPSKLGDYTIEVLQSASETGGKLLVVEVLLAPKGGNDLHYHTTFEEEFSVQQGVLGVQLEKEVLHLRPGQTATAPRHKLHRFFNPSDTEAVRFMVRITPPRQFEACLRIAHGLANDGKTTSKGIPKSLWHLALLFEMGESYVPLLPHRLQLLLCGLLAGLARRLGKDKELDRYWQPDAESARREQSIPVDATQAARE